MKRTACVASVLAVLIMAARADDSTPSIKEIMGKLHKGDNAPLAKLKTALKHDTPDWKDVQDLSKDFVSLGAGLAKNKPPKGTNSAFKKRTDAYYQYAKGSRRRRQGRGQGQGGVGAEQDRGLVQGLPLSPQEVMRSSSDRTAAARSVGKRPNGRRRRMKVGPR